MCSIEDCARIKLAELAMKEYGLLKDISYRTFLDNLERENQRREEKFKALLRKAQGCLLSSFGQHRGRKDHPAL